MRRLVLASLAVALVGFAGLADAASRQGRADFVPLANSGISGRVRLTGQTGKVQTHIVLQVRGLQDAEYVAVGYTNNNCQAEAQVFELGRFRPRTSGMTTWTGRVDRDIEQIGSISLRLASDQSAQACGSVVMQ